MGNYHFLPCLQCFLPCQGMKSLFYHNTMYGRIDIKNGFIVMVFKRRFSNLSLEPIMLQSVCTLKNGDAKARVKHLNKL